jgi:type I restriction enzyme S subunit
MNLPRVPISKVAEVNPRLTSKPQANELVSFVPMAAVSEKTVSIESPIDRPFAEVSKGFTTFQRGDVIIAKITPCFENGKMAHAVDLPRAIGVGSTEFHVLRPKPLLNGAYLFHMLRLPAVRLDGARKMQGAAGQRRVPADFFGSLQIPLPPVDEQKRIAAILDAADALRTKRREALAQLDALLQSTFLTLFGDPVANQMGWKVKPLGDFCKTGTGGTPSRSKIERYYEGGTIPWVKSGELRENIITHTSEHVTATALKETNVKLVPKDAILLALYGATVGRLGILGVGATTNQAVCHIIPNQQSANLTYMFHALSNQVPYLVGRGVGGAQPNISQGIVKALEIPLPPLPLQQKFARIVESVERQKAAQRAHLAELDALFAALQHSAFRGEL